MDMKFSTKIQMMSLRINCHHHHVKVPILINQPYILCVCCSPDIYIFFFLQTIDMSEFDICTRFDGISSSHSIAYWPAFTLGSVGD